MSVGNPFFPGSPTIIIEGNKVTVESAGGSETVDASGMSREELLVIALGGSHDDYQEMLRQRAEDEHQRSLLAKRVPGAKFKADAALLKLCPECPVWHINRKAATWTIIGEEQIPNKLCNLWWCSPDAPNDGFLEALVRLDNLNDSFFVA
jgi:hypothetical protein